MSLTAFHTEISLAQAFEKFRLHFPYTRVAVHADEMVYTIRNKRYADSIGRDARKLIEEMQLPLLGEVRKGMIDATLLITENKKLRS